MDDSYHSEPLSPKFEQARAFFNGTFCRLCFSQNHKLHRIFPPNDAPDQLLINKIEYCTGVRMSCSADSNASVCAKCIDRTEKLFRFKQLCVANEHCLKMDTGSACVGNGASATVSLTREIGDQMIRADSCESLLTIGTEQLEEDLPDCGEEFADRETGEPNRVTCSDDRLRPRNKVTRRSLETATEDPKDYQKSSTAFSLIRGTKSRSGRLYLLYKGYHYSDYQSKKNVYRCTQRAPVYCRAKVLLKNDRVYEINENTHDHPLPRKCKPRRIVNFKV